MDSSGTLATQNLSLAWLVAIARTWSVAELASVQEGVVACRSLACVAVLVVNPVLAFGFIKLLAVLSMPATYMVIIQPDRPALCRGHMGLRSLSAIVYIRPNFFTASGLQCVRCRQQLVEQRAELLPRQAVGDGHEWHVSEGPWLYVI